MKPGYQTTEFYVTTGTALAGFLLAIGIFTPDQSETVNKALADGGSLLNQFIIIARETVEKAGGIIAMVVAAFRYTKSRGEIKRAEE